MADDIGLFEAIHTQRALRYIKPDPVPDALIRKVVEAGTRAPNGGNQQRWRFVVIKDAETKRWIQERYRTTDRPAHAASPLILCCVQHDGSPSDIQRGASIYPAARNRYGPTNRRPVEEVTFAETWGKRWHA